MEEAGGWLSLGILIRRISTSLVLPVDCYCDHHLAPPAGGGGMFDGLTMTGTEARVDDDGEDPWLILLGVLRTHPTIDSTPPR